MTNLPNASELHLESCCERTLDRIRQKIKAGRDLKIVLGASPFLSVLDGPIPFFVSALMHDWRLWTDSMRGIDAITRRACADEAAWHYLDHSMARSKGPICSFWMAMEESFK